MNTETPALLPEVTAPAGWRSVDLISDLHLHEGEPVTFTLWRHYLQSTPADAVFILGDLFEAWIGDDVAVEPGFEAECAEVLRAAAQQRPLYFLHGNRDFLVGHLLAERTGLQRLHDPAVLSFAGVRWLLTHGDALCLDDVAYLRFRAQVRDPAWQAALLAKPLVERRGIARALRAESNTQKRVAPTFADVDREAALQWLQAAGARHLIHGHTHRPGEHALDATHRRIVLSDWDATASPPRAEVLRLHADGRSLRQALC